MFEANSSKISFSFGKISVSLHSPSSTVGLILILDIRFERFRSCLVVSDESYTHLEQAVFEIGFSFCKFSLSLCSPYSTVGLR